MSKVGSSYTPLGMERNAVVIQTPKTWTYGTTPKTWGLITTKKDNIYIGTLRDHNRISYHLAQAIINLHINNTTPRMTSQQITDLIDKLATTHGY